MERDLLEDCHQTTSLRLRRVPFTIQLQQWDRCITHLVKGLTLIRTMVLMAMECQVQLGLSQESSSIDDKAVDGPSNPSLDGYHAPTSEPRPFERLLTVANQHNSGRLHT